MAQQAHKVQQALMGPLAHKVQQELPEQPVQFQDLLAHKVLQVHWE
jgi:hypothetical protein